MPDNKHSQAITQGSKRAPNRAMLRAVGFSDGDFTKPIVGVANGFSTITPCNMGLSDLAMDAESAIRTSGAMPQLFGTITISDGISMGTEGMKYSLVSREVIADSIETAVKGESMDGVITIGGCDKNMPGAMIAIARMNVPAIFFMVVRLSRGNTKAKISLSSAHLKLWGSITRIKLMMRNCWESNVMLVQAQVHVVACLPRTPCHLRLKPWV